MVNKSYGSIGHIAEIDVDYIVLEIVDEKEDIHRTVTLFRVTLLRVLQKNVAMQVLV